METNFTGEQMFSEPVSTATIELASSFSARPPISHVIFDMDGTLSWLRHGWPQIMCELFRAHFPVLAGETEKTVHDLLISEILSLNGRQSIYQMIAFCERVRKRDGDCPGPDELLHEYQHRLDAVIEERSQKLLRGETKPDEFVVFGARAFLEKLRQRGLTLIILSGTIEHRVKHEAALLGLAEFFGKHIYGGTMDHSPFSKKLVIDRLLREEAISGNQLLSFGDGPVEIAETKNVGGLAVAVASDEEENGSGIADPWKREQLRKAGADAVMADYRNADELLKRIFGK